MKYGHVKISRKAYAKDPFWNEPREFSRWEAQEWFFQAAAWEPIAKDIDGVVVQLQRGEVLASLRYLAAVFGWTHKRARGFVDLLKNRATIRAQRETPVGTVYLLVNYSIYQGDVEVAESKKGTAKGTARAQRGHSKGHNIKAVKSSKAVNSNSRAQPESPTLDDPDAWKPDPTDGPTDLEKSIDRIIQQANAGILENPTLPKASVLSLRHRSRKTVAGWIASGTSVDTLGEIVFRLAKAYRPDGVYNRISTMDYFAAAVAEEQERPAAVTPISRAKKSDVDRWREANPAEYAEMEAKIDAWMDEHPTLSRATEGVRRTHKQDAIRDAVRRRIDHPLTEATG